MKRPTHRAWAELMPLTFRSLLGRRPGRRLGRSGDARGRADLHVLDNPARDAARRTGHAVPHRTAIRLTAACRTAIRQTAAHAAGTASAATAAGTGVDARVVAIAVARIAAVGRVAVEIAPVDFPATIAAPGRDTEQSTDQPQRPAKSTRGQSTPTTRRSTHRSARRLAERIARRRFHPFVRQPDCRPTRRTGGRTSRAAMLCTERRSRPERSVDN